jgi:hypothetical protein
MYVHLGVELLNIAPLRRMSQDALAELKSLAKIIQSSVEQIEQVVTANSFDFPSPLSPYSLESEAPRMHPAIQSAGSLVTSAAAQLMTLVRPTPLAMQDTMNQVRFETLPLCFYFPLRRKNEVSCFYRDPYRG